MASRLDKFSQKYDFFLADASNEEIVSISKELSDELATQTKSLNATAIAMIGICSFALMFSIMLVSQSTESGTLKTAIFFLRIAAVAFMLIALIMSVMASSKALRASSISPMMWRNVRETASDEKVYEQMAAISELNKTVFKSKNNIRMSSLFLFIGGACLAFAFIVSLLAANGYI